MAAGNCKYSCQTAAETRNWINAIADFLRPYTSLINAHVVNFFKDDLWDVIDKEWIDCLSIEPVANLLLIPSGVVQDCWVASLKEFVLTSRSLVFCRQQVDLEKAFSNLHMTSLSSVLSQGMNLKKKHEVETLSTIIYSIAKNAKITTVVDVGSGQGYLAQVLSFHYGLCVTAVDACSHHGRVTSARSERIKKHYASELCKSKPEGRRLNELKSITCRIMSSAMLKSLSNTSLIRNDAECSKMNKQDGEELHLSKIQSSYNADGRTSIILAGLHACGDLSVTMLKSFLECPEVKAVVSIGCCYNLLSEESAENASFSCGFPMSNGVRCAHLSLGKSARDLACQSAERWRCLDKDAGIHNFELHAFRAAFQLVLSKYYPEILIKSPSIGRQGKALRRQQQRRAIESPHYHNGATHLFIAQEDLAEKLIDCKMSYSTSEVDASNRCSEHEAPESADRYHLFEKFCQSGFDRLGLQWFPDINLQDIWKETAPFRGLIGPYWSLRAALGPVLETLILLDRLLFLQKAGSSIEATMLPIFDPTLSPRNVAIIGQRK